MDFVLQKAWETALERVDLDACRSLIARGVDIHAPVLIGPTALHFAVSQRHFALAGLLLDHCATIDHSGGTACRTALALAVSKSDREMAAFLIDAGASLSYAPAKAEVAYLTPYQTLVRDGKVDDVRHYTVRYGVDLGQRTLAGKTLIQLCAGNAEMKAMIRALKTERAVEGQLVAPADDRSSRCAPRDYGSL